MPLEDGDWEKAAQSVEKYDFRLIVLKGKGKMIYKNAKHNEIESAEALFQTKRDGEKIESYLIENTTILARDTQIDGVIYHLFFVSCPGRKSILGMDRGMFEVFLLVVLDVGIVVILFILLLSQIMTKRLIRSIMQPVQLLNHAANRITEGNLDEPIGYQK